MWPPPPPVAPRISLPSPHQEPASHLRVNVCYDDAVDKAGADALAQNNNNCFLPDKCVAGATTPTSTSDNTLRTSTAKGAEIDCDIKTLMENFTDARWAPTTCDLGSTCFKGKIC